jgi:prephenate dehydrogenase
MKIAVIGGAGKMGSWFAAFFSNIGHEVIISDTNAAGLSEVCQRLNIKSASAGEAVSGSDAVIISVDIDSFENAVKEISPFIKLSQILVDVTSVKQKPVDIMHQCCPQAKIMGIHPLFGPGARDLVGQNLVLTPYGEEEQEFADEIKDYLADLGARVSIMTPYEHDSMMSVVLGLAHYITIVAADSLSVFENQAQLKSIGGSTYRVLTTLVESVISEDPELYATLQMHLPGLADMEDRFQQNAARWANLVKAGDKEGFKKGMIELKKRYSAANANFGRAYENMYKIMEWL